MGPVGAAGSPGTCTLIKNSLPASRKCTLSLRANLAYGGCAGDQGDGAVRLGVGEGSSDCAEGGLSACGIVESFGPGKDFHKGSPRAEELKFQLMLRWIPI